MTRGLRHLLIHSFAICLLFFSSVLSAAAMAPSSQDASRAEVLQMGYTVDDLCADDHAAHDHSCPFCTLLPEAKGARLARGHAARDAACPVAIR